MPISEIQAVLKLWMVRRLSLQGKITVFKSLAISKIVYLSLLASVPNNSIEELIKIQKKTFYETSRLLKSVKH